MEETPIHAEVQEKSDFHYQLVGFNLLDKENYVTDLISLQNVATGKLRLIFLAQQHWLCKSA